MKCVVNLSDFKFNLLLCKLNYSFFQRLLINHTLIKMYMILSLQLLQRNLYNFIHKYTSVHACTIHVHVYIYP